MKCKRCGIEVYPGKDGMIIGLSTEPDGDPLGAILDTMVAVHYREFCGRPDVVLEPMKLGPLDIYPVR